MEKQFSMERGLDTTIFCPTEVDMHGQPNRMRRAQQESTLHTSGVRECHSVCVGVCVRVCFLHMCALRYVGEEMEWLFEVLL